VNPSVQSQAIKALTTVRGLHWNDSGQAALTGELARYADRLDRAFARWAASLGAEPLLPPPCLPPGVPERCGYLLSFPHHATMAVPVADDDGEDPVRSLLTPAACYHVYPTLEDSHLNRPVFLTLRATCFRNEDVFLPLERQWSFSMREVVCVGADEDVSRFLETARKTASAWCEILGVPIRLDRATDPFFDPASSPGWLMQRLLPLKTELLSDGLAIGSFNSHQSFFGETFSIRVCGQPAWTGCAAFGLERWLLALIRRHGPDACGWPDPETLA